MLEYLCMRCGKVIHKTPEMQFEAFDKVDVPLIQNPCCREFTIHTHPDYTASPEGTDDRTRRSSRSKTG